MLLDAGADAAATDSLGRAASDMVKARGVKAESFWVGRPKAL